MNGVDSAVPGLAGHTKASAPRQAGAPLEPSSSCDVSVVVPTFNGAACLRELCGRVAATMDARRLSWEIVLVDDASPDGTGDLARYLMAEEPRLRYVPLSENRGQHAATAIGLRQANGAVLVTMDDDLQQAPESIPLLLDAVAGGAHVAIARFTRSSHPLWRRVGSRVVQLVLNRRAAGRPLTMTSFKAFRRDAAARVLRAVPERGGFYLGALVLQHVSRDLIVNVEVPHFARRSGSSSYRPLTLARMTLTAIRSATERRG